MELLALGPRSAPELADALGVHVRTARRILKRLESEGYVALGRDRRRRYHPTMRIVAVAGQVVERAELTHTALPQVRALRDELGEDCHLGVPSHLSVLCLVHANGHRDSSRPPQLRELVPCHCTATGKALLAWREPWREAILTQPLASFTERTTTGPEWLRRELGRTVARGYSIEDREFDPDARGVAAPVFSDTGEAVAALAMVAPASRLPAERYRDIGGAVMHAARALTQQLRSDDQTQS
ncbi:MAG: IclR family transcriptional regulator [Thermoleophilaceae bacterium]|nr:IclR family transcriptional regulator [Thermoleophilaceae bacterium]